MKLVLIGGGGHCKSVLDSAINCMKYEDIVVTDKSGHRGDTNMTMHVVGGDDCLQELFDQGYRFAIITVGSIETTVLRRCLVSFVKDIGFQFETVVDSCAELSAYSEIGEGCFVGKKL